MTSLWNTIQVFNGWMAMVLITHSALSIFFACFLAFIFLLLVWSQFTNPEFDIMDMVYTYDASLKRKSLNTAKTLLTGAFITSTFYVIKHDSDAAFFAYLTAWVANGGIYAWSKPKTKSEVVTPEKKEGLIS
jgi:hypothetical protein